MKAILRGQLPVTAVQTVSSRYARGTRRAGRASFRLSQTGDGASEVRVRVLFVCLDNSCRSRMAEVFANHYGSDVLRAESAGIRPAPYVSAASQGLSSLSSEVPTSAIIGFASASIMPKTAGGRGVETRVS